MGKGSAGLNKGAGIGIRPGAGKQANEFDVLDEEDKQIAAANEAKAQGGIPPGADHPLVASHKIKAVKRSEWQSKLENMTEDRKADFLARVERGEINAEDGTAIVQDKGDDEEEKDHLGRPLEKPPWVDIPIDLKEVAWFRTNYRLKRFADSNPSDLLQLVPLDDVSKRGAEFAKINAVEKEDRYKARSKADKVRAAEKAAYEKEQAKERIMQSVATFELQVFDH
jgi:hypothetical protein